MKNVKYSRYYKIENRKQRDNGEYNELRQRMLCNLLLQVDILSKLIDY